jgi:3-oxoacyl-[acyl-carrier protein] reductase
MKTISLEGKAAVVTGASRGLGRAIAEEYLRAGADLAVNYNRTPVDDLLALAAELGRRAIAVQADVASVADCESIVETAVKEFGKIDILVNNAGITRDGLLLRMDEAAWDAVITTNLKSVFACSRAAAKHMMRARSGCIINVSSVAGLRGNMGQTNYAASKAGVIGFTKSLARELAGRGVRVNAIAPGFITSDMTNVLGEKVREAVLQEIPMARFGEPADIAGAALYLASPLANYVTGAVLVVDGGLAM